MPVHEAEAGGLGADALAGTPLPDGGEMERPAEPGGIPDGKGQPGS